MLDSLLMIRTNADTRGHIEFMVQGDLFSPWVGTDPDLTIPSVVAASNMSKASIVLLNCWFALRPRAGSRFTAR